MNDCLESSSQAGRVVGGIAGCAVGVWVCIFFIKPALAQTKLTDAEANAATAAIAVLGFLPLCAVLGLVIGMTGGFALASCGLGTATAARGLFAHRKPQNLSMAEAAVPVSDTSVTVSG